MAAAGAASGVFGEIVGDAIYQNGQGLNRQNTIELSKIVGALTSAAIAGPDDGDSVFAGSQIARNAVENNFFGNGFVVYQNIDEEEYKAGEKSDKLTLESSYKLTPMGTSELIENYTGQELTWKEGDIARFKLKGKEFETAVAGSNTIGMANTVEGNRASLAGQPLTSDLKYSPRWDQEGGWLSLQANKAKGMNAMSVVHDKWGENKFIATPGILQISIIPAIPITYYRLVGKSIRNLYEDKKPK